MYGFIVRRVIRASFRWISSGDSETVVACFAPDITFRFAGNHALGGALQGQAAVRQWFARLYRLFPDSQLVPTAIAVSGWPWATTVATRFRVEATLPEGRRYRNDGVQLLRLRWGRAVDDTLYEDTQRLVEALHFLAARGSGEALAPPFAAATDA